MQSRPASTRGQHRHRRFVLPRLRRTAARRPPGPARERGGELRLRGDTNAHDTLPAWNSRDGHRYLIWKTFLAVTPSARPYRIVTVTSPATARLFYASPARWGIVSGSKVIARPPRRIRLPSCGRQYTGYTGGILITRPACVTLAVSRPAGKSATVTVPILVTRC